MGDLLFAIAVGFVFFFLPVYFLARWLKRPKGNPVKVRERQISELANFSPVMRWTQPDNETMLVLDPHSSQFAVAKLNAAPRLYHFDQLVAVDVERDGTSLEKSNRGSQIMGAAVGGLLLGPVGMVIGGLSGSKRTEERIKRLSLKLYTNDLHAPVSEIVFFDYPFGEKPDSQFVKLSAAQLDEWYGRFRTILQANERGAPAPSAPADNNAPDGSPSQGFGRRRSLVTPG